MGYYLKVIGQDATIIIICCIGRVPMKLLSIFIFIGTIAVMWIGFHEQFTEYLVSFILISTLVIVFFIGFKIFTRNSKVMRRSNIKIQLLED